MHKNIKFTLPHIQFPFISCYEIPLQSISYSHWKHAGFFILCPRCASYIYQLRYSTLSLYPWSPMLGSSKQSGLGWLTVCLPQDPNVFIFSNTWVENFDSAIVSAISTGQVVDIKDPAIPGLYSWVPTFLKGRILLAQSCSEGATSKDKAITVISHVNQSLDQLTRPGDEHW